MIASAARRSCTACRMTKCLAIGMELEKVMKKGEEGGVGENVDIGDNSINRESKNANNGSKSQLLPQPLVTTSTNSNAENLMKVLIKSADKIYNQSLEVVSTRKGTKKMKAKRNQLIFDTLLELSIRQQLTFCCSCAPFQCTCSLKSGSSNSPFSSGKVKKGQTKYANDLIFNDFELNQLRALRDANGHLVDECTLPVVRVETSFENVVNLPVFYLKLVIRYCKALLPDFAHFSENCQMALLKAFFTDFIFIRIAFNYDPASGEFRYISVMFKSLIKILIA